MLESYYIIKSLIEDNNKYYYVNITETKYEYNILVGGIKMKCVNIMMDKKREVALLELVQHHNKCSLNDETEDHKNMTLSDFLVGVNNYDCIFYEKIFNDMIGNILQGTNWIITRKKIEEYNMASNITETNKIKENDNLNVLFRKLNLLNKKENKKMGGNIYHSGII